MEEKMKTLLLFIISWVFIYLIYISHTSNLFKITLSVIFLFIAGEYLNRTHKLDKEMVFLLWKDKRYLNILKSIANRCKGYFLLMADMGLFMAFGLFAFKIIKWRNIKEKILLGIAGYGMLLLISFIYSPSISLLMVMLGIAKTGVGSSLSSMAYIVFIIGIAPSAFLALLYSSFIIAVSLIKLILGEKVVVMQATTLLLPGINIPFLEGVISLIILLIVHEFSHGILAIIEKIKVNSMGIVTFGTIPIGAFVEPDEKKLFKSGDKSILRVVIAGVSANFLLAVVLFAILLGFLYSTLSFSENSCLLVNGSKVIQARFCSPDKIITTDGSIINLNKDEKFEIINLGRSGLIRYYPNPILSIIYNILLLSTSLNLVVGIINLLPIPFFDGDLIFSRIMPERIHKIIKYLALASLIISLAPGLL